MSPGLIISAGMPRAGSGWYYNLVHDLVVAGGGQNAREIRKKYYLQDFLTEVNCNISTLKFLRLMPVLIPTVFGNKYVVKTHAGPTRFSNWLNRSGRISMTYIFRDPRAALLSAYEYGQKAIKKDRENAFSQLKSIDEAGEFMKFYIRIWEAWSQADNVLMVRYENFIIDYPLEYKRLLDHLDLKVDQTQGDHIFDEYRPEKGQSGRKGTHFSKGQAERFRDEFSPNQLEQFTTMFETEISQMGYSP